MSETLETPHPGEPKCCESWSLDFGVGILDLEFVF